MQNIAKRIPILRKMQCKMMKNIPHILPTNNRHLLSLKKCSNKLMVNE